MVKNNHNNFSTGREFLARLRAACGGQAKPPSI
jgi:hypothetical protein